MHNSFIRRIAVALILVLLLPVSAFAHDWQDGYCDSNNDGYTHTHYYYCDDCGEEYSTTEYCAWKRTGSDYTDWSSKKHRYEVEYECPDCYAYKTDVSYEEHTFKWVRYGRNFWYECKYCGNAPKFNGNILTDSNDTDNITIRKGKKYTYRMYNYNKSRNKVKSIKYSKKKICSIKKKGKKLIITGKKRGKCKVTVTMKSGAKYTLKVKVK